MVLLALGCGASASSAAAPAASAAEAAAAPEASSAEAAPAAPAAAAQAAAPESDATYPTPYTAEQIRDATRPGRAYTWKLEQSGQPAIERTTTFARVDSDGAEIVSGAATKRVTWEELRQHAAFPRAQVTTRDETVTVPAGTYDCIVYVVNDAAAGEVSTFYFSKAMPGAPVLFFTEKSGVRLLTNTLIRYSAGTGG